MNRIIPLSFDVELTNICHNACRMCPREKIKRPFGAISDDVFEILVEALKAWKPLITFSGMGDPLLHPDYDRFIMLAKDHDIDVGMVINPTSLNNEHIERIINAKPNSVLISFPSLRKDVFECLCPGISLEDALELTKILVEKARNKIGIRISGILTGLNSDESISFINFWKSKKVNAFMAKCHSRGGNLRDSTIYSPENVEKINNHQCSLYKFHTFIDWQGQVLACCHDLTGETEIENIKHGWDVIQREKGKFLKQNPFFNLCKKCDEPLKNTVIPDNIDFIEVSDIRKFRKNFFKGLR